VGFAFLSFVASAAALGCEWALFGALQATMRKDVAGKVAWGPAHWMLLAATAFLALAPVAGSIEWVRARRRKRDTGLYAPLKSMKNATYQF
jgi:hypothetical protein